MSVFLRYAGVLVAIIVTSIAVLAVAVQPARAQTPRLEALVAEALDRNPALQAARHRRDAVEQEEPQVTSYPDPAFTYTRWLSSPETRVGPQRNVLAFGQKIPYPGKLSLRGAMSGEKTAAETARMQSIARDITHEVKRVYYDLYRVDRSLRILDDYLVMLETFTGAAEEKYATGGGTQADVLKSHVEVSEILKRRIALEGERVALAARLNAVLSRPSDTAVDQVAAIDTTRYARPKSLVVERALAVRQELVAVDARIRRNELGVRLARLASRPDFTVQASYITVPRVGGNAVSDAGKDALGVMLNVNLPLFRKRIRAEEQEAVARVEESRYIRKNIQDTVAAEVAEAYGRLRHSGRALAVYEQGLIAQAENSVLATLAAYQTGQMDFLDLLDAERMVLRTRLGYVAETANYRKYLSLLERAAGGSLP
ncbi:MAG: TolC family protein [Gemmatimonadetes bacterium]|nr:TolC family protein [Gemmatimonadota bacterium]